MINENANGRFPSYSTQLIQPLMGPSRISAADKQGLVLNFFYYPTLINSLFSWPNTPVGHCPIFVMAPWETVVGKSRNLWRNNHTFLIHLIAYLPYYAWGIPEKYGKRKIQRATPQLMEGWNNRLPIGRSSRDPTREKQPGRGSYRKKVSPVAGAGRGHSSETRGPQTSHI